MWANGVCEYSGRWEREEVVMTRRTHRREDRGLSQRVTPENKPMGLVDTSSHLLDKG